MTPQTTDTDAATAHGGAQLLTHTPAEVVPSRFCWPYLSGEEATQLWVELVEWVQWLRRRYQFEDSENGRIGIPRCWFRHGAWIEELTALMEAWLAAHHRSPTEEQPPITYAAAQFTTAAAYWHRTFLWPLLADAKKIAPHDHHDGECDRAFIEDLHPDLPEWIAADTLARPIPSVRGERITAFTAAAAAVDDAACAAVDAGAGEEPVITAADMAAYLASGAARPVDGADAASMWPDAEYGGQVWTHDRRLGSYRPRGDTPPTGGGGEQA